MTHLILVFHYITEKPWNALNVGMIPIVHGLGDYAKALPPHSYIDVRDFKHPGILAGYLKRVALNETLYKYSRGPLILAEILRGKRNYII